MDEYRYREYKWITVQLNKKQLAEEGKKRYEKLRREIENENNKILSHSAEMKKSNPSTWELTGHIGYLCSETKKRYVKENEWQVERKAEDESIE